MCVFEGLTKSEVHASQARRSFEKAFGAKEIIIIIIISYRGRISTCGSKPLLEGEQGAPTWCVVECMSASPIVEEVDISGSGAYISSKIVESSLRKLLGRASGRTPPGRDLAPINTADARKVSMPRQVT